MNFEAYFGPYPSLKAVFWPGAKRISWNQKKPHPLLGLVLRDDNRARHVADRTDACCKAIARLHPKWLQAKAAVILKEHDLQNVSAALGEIRAFGEVIWVWREGVRPGRSGHDFSLIQKADEVRIEVNTPQHRTKRHSIAHERNESKGISFQVSEVFPFGWPQRSNKDNVQGEAVSKLAAIKQDERQFAAKSINILWCDLKDPVLWPCDFGNNHFEPLSTFREEITSGAFWNSLYARRGTPIYDGLPVGGYLSRKPYLMEYEGRFWGNSKLDFVIADTRRAQVVFQNPNRARQVPDWVLRDLHRLFAFNLRASWLDWPCRGQLNDKVQLELAQIKGYEKAFELGE